MTAVTLLLSILLASADAEPTPVEHVTDRPQRGDGTLGTTVYAPSEREQPYFEKLPEEEVATGGLTGDYDISRHAGKYVGWFGVVREIEEDEAQGRTTLLVEHKYFDGLTDLHIQALSFNGSGDFRAVLRGVGHGIEPLSLVKVYGDVSQGDADQLPTVDAAFVRNWHWGTFTFLMAAGEQRGSEQWRKLNRVALDEIYTPYPDDHYYEARLGPRPKPAVPGKNGRKRTGRDSSANCTPQRTWNCRPGFPRFFGGIGARKRERRLATARPSSVPLLAAASL